MQTDDPPEKWIDNLEKGDKPESSEEEAWRNDKEQELINEGSSDWEDEWGDQTEETFDD